MGTTTTRSLIDRLYHAEYYLSDCEGHAEFQRSRGRKLSRRLAKCLKLTNARAGELWIDLGCGRGEIARHLGARGVRVVGVDPSRAALQIASAACPPEPGTSAPGGPTSTSPEPRFLQAFGESLPLRDRSVDGIVLSDVVEHVTRNELDLLLRESRRVLRDDGRIVIHTQPNRWLVQITVPLLSRLSRLWGVRLPRDLRKEMTAGSGPDYHPNEQTLHGLRRALRRAGLQPQESWLEGTYAVHRIFGESRLKKPLLNAFRRSPLLKAFLATQVFAVARKAEA